MTSNQEHCGVAWWPAEPTSQSPRWPTSKANFQYGAACPWRWCYSQGVVCWEDCKVDGGEAGTGLLRRVEQRKINLPLRFTCLMLSGPKSTWISNRWGIEIEHILPYFENLKKKEHPASFVATTTVQTGPKLIRRCIEGCVIFTSLLVFNTYSICTMQKSTWSRGILAEEAFRRKWVDAEVKP